MRAGQLRQDFFSCSASAARCARLPMATSAAAREQSSSALSPAPRNKNTHRGARTHDHKVKGLALYRLSLAGLVAAVAAAQRQAGAREQPCRQTGLLFAPSFSLRRERRAAFAPHAAARKKIPAACCSADQKKTPAPAASFAARPKLREKRPQGGSNSRPSG